MAILRGRHAAPLLALVLVALRAPAGPPIASEFEVKAAFLCSFPEFVEWPETAPGSPIRIGILGVDPFGTLLDETVKARPLQTKSLEIVRLAGPREALRCQIVYICASEARDLAAHLGILDGASVLTVSDIPRFAERKGMIGFVMVDRRVRFQINPAPAERVGLRISSRLLSLARVVGSSRSPG